MKRVLVTGGAGFIGQHTIDPLIEAGYDVHIVTQHANKLLPAQVAAHQANLLDNNQHQQLMNSIRPSHLLHTAWYTKNGLFWDAEDNEVWLDASLSLAEAFFAAGGQRLVGLGTCAEYDWREGVFEENVTPEVPATLYGKTKKFLYESLCAMSHAQAKSVAWARIFFPYGPGEADARLIPYVINRLLRGEKAECTKGDQIRDFLHVKDVGCALVAVLDSDVEGAVNIGSGSPVKISDVIMRIAEILDRADLVKLGAIATPPHSPDCILAKTHRLNNEVGWFPGLTLHEGLSSAIHWWREIGNINVMKGEHV